MQYLTYEEYSKMGGVCDEAAFNRYIDRANSIIDYETHRRIEMMEKVPNPAKALCRDLVEYFAAFQETSKTVTSRSHSSGPVSESESYATKTREEQENDIDALVCDYLLGVVDDNGVQLLFRGYS